MTKEVQMGRSLPSSIRFDPEKLELVKRKERLTTPQKVVDFLMDAYYWQNKLVAAQAMNAAQNLPYVTPADERSPYEAFAWKIQHANSLPELEQIGELLKNELLIKQADRDRLINMAKWAAKTFEV